MCVVRSYRLTIANNKQKRVYQTDNMIHSI